MAVDAELISSEGFNLKFKNYLRDFFIYQFKERGSDFKVKGTNDKTNVNKDIIDGTFYPDAKRLQFALEQAAGVTWSKGDFADLTSERINKKRENKRVECITIDSRRIENNPFFTLYQLCSESALTPGTHFSFVYTILLYFNLGKHIKRTDYAKLTQEQLNELNDYLIRFAEDIESEIRRHRPRSWEEFSEEEKTKFALEAIDKFSKDHYGLEEIYNHMILNKMKLTYSDGQFAIQNDDSAFIEKNILFDVLSQYGIEVDEKQFGNKMQELTRLGIIKSEKRGQRIYYALSNAYLSDVFGNDEDLSNRFANCVSFFSQISPLGEIGTYIQSRLPKCNVDSMRFKHNYIKRALNDYNNIDLLYAIKNNLCALIEYRNASLNDLEYQKILCYPIEIRESVTDGRQYLIYYHPLFRSVSAARIEFIDSIILGKLPKSEYYNDDILRAKELINHTWGTAFDNFQEGNVKTPFEPQRVRVIVSFGENEEFIKARLQREIRNCASLDELDIDEYGRCIEVVAEIANPWEMLQWLRSYITRVVSIEINEKKYDDFTNDVIRTYESYIEPSAKTTQNISSRTGKSLLYDDVPVEFRQLNNMHSLLFNEIFSKPFIELGNILFDIIRTKTISAEHNIELQKAYSRNFTAIESANRRKEQAYNFIFAFVNFGDGRSVFEFLNDEINNPIDLLPLTLLEIQWMVNILKHPLAKCFLNENEIKVILDKVEDPEIFDINKVVLYDQYLGVDEFYKSFDFSTLIPKIMSAIRDNRMIAINYKSQYGKRSDYVCSPVDIEYSKRDNKIRIRAVSKSNDVKTFNLERILDVDILDELYDKDFAEDVIKKYLNENQCELVIFFNETKNVPDRILTEFSCFKKKCCKWGNERYRMTLYYDKEDKREILVRLLSYGSLINVFNDTGDVRHELIERLERQLELTNSLDLVFAKESKEEKTK